MLVTRTNVKDLLIPATLQAREAFPNPGQPNLQRVQGQHIQFLETFWQGACSKKNKEIKRARDKLQCNRYLPTITKAPALLAIQLQHFGIFAVT